MQERKPLLVLQPALITGQNPLTIDDFKVVFVPEPSTMVLLGVALLAIVD